MRVKTVIVGLLLLGACDGGDNDLSSGSAGTASTTPTREELAATTVQTAAPSTTRPTPPPPRPTAPPTTAAPDTEAPTTVRPTTTTLQIDEPEVLMPSVVCMNLQDAQDAIQEAGVFFSRSTDATGEGRMQVLDRNWIVVAQSPPPGTPIEELEAVLDVVKVDEPNPC